MPFGIFFSREEYFFFAQISCAIGGILNLTNEFFSRKWVFR